MQTKTKKNVGYKIAIAALVLLLTIAMILTATGAWFQDSAKNEDDIVMGDPVTIKIEESDGADVPTWSAYSEFQYKDAMPGDKITDNIQFVVPETTSPMYLRAKLSIAITKLGEATTADAIDAALTGEADRLAGLTGTDLQAEYPTLTAEALTTRQTADVAALRGAVGDVNRGLSTAWIPGSDGWSYYELVVDSEATETPITACASVRIPEAWVNFLANAEITLNIEVEAMQAANCPWAKEGQPMHALLGTEAGEVDAYDPDSRLPVAP